MCTFDLSGTSEDPHKTGFEEYVGSQTGTKNIMKKDTKHDGILKIKNQNKGER